MSDISTVRRRIGDRAKAQRDVATGDNTTRSFHTQYQNVFNMVVMVNGTEQDSGTGYTLDASSGRILFTTAPAANAEVTFDYLYAAYTDEELQGLIDEYGVDGATIACLEELAADSARFYDFTQGETTTKRSQIFDHLQKLLQQYRDKADKEAAAKRSGISFGKRSSGRSAPRRRPNFGGTQDLTRYP